MDSTTPSSRHMPSTSRLQVDVRGAKIVDDFDDTKDGEDTPETSDIYLPKHTEWISHIAVDIGGSLAKVVYFTRAPSKKNGLIQSSQDDISPLASSSPSILDEPQQNGNGFEAPTKLKTTPSSTRINGILGPQSVKTSPSASANGHSSSLIPIHKSSSRATATPLPPLSTSPSSAFVTSRLRRRNSSISSLSGGRLNFTKFETTDLAALTSFISHLLELSAVSHGVPLSTFKKSVKIMATGGGAHLYGEMLREELGVEVRREDEMECLIEGLGFVMEIPGEVFWYSDELVREISQHKPVPFSSELESPNSPQTDISASPTSVKSPTKSLQDQPAKTVHSVSSPLLSSQPIQDIAPGQRPADSDNITSTTGTSSLASSWGAEDEFPSPSNSPGPPAPDTPTSSNSPPIESLPRPSPDPPQYSLLFESSPHPQFPCLLVNIGSGVSIIKVDDYGKFERISGTSLGGGTLWGLLSLLTGAASFDDMLKLSELGDNGTVDMLVGDIYGKHDHLAKIGLKSSTIASSFGKVFRKGDTGRRKDFRPEDIAKSLLYAISNNIGQIAYMNAEKHNLDKIYFGGCFIRSHAATMATLSYAIRFWSKGTKRALFLRHEGYLGAMGAWLRNVQSYEEDAAATLEQQQQQQQQDNDNTITHTNL